MNDEENEAALLAELMMISKKSAASRFDDNEGDDTHGTDDQLPNGSSATPNTTSFKKNENKVNVMPEQEEKKTEKATPEKFQDDNVSARQNASSRTNGELPPWKRNRPGSASSKQTNMMEVDIVVATDSKTQCAVPPSPKIASIEDTIESTSDPPMESLESNDFRQMSTFKGERGGEAHDEELLALLKAASKKSNASDRFADDDGEKNEPDSECVVETKPAVPQPSPPKDKTSRKSRDPNIIPPWKRGKNKKAASASPVADIIVAAPLTSAKSESATKTFCVAEPLEAISNVEEGEKSKIISGGGNFRQQSTFQGERGGEANDPELLALLKGVSSKSNATDRFACGDGDGSDAMAAVSSTVEPKSNPTQRRSNDIPPWKRKKTPKPGATDASTDVVVEAKTGVESASSGNANDLPTFPSDIDALPETAAFGGGNFKQESTFQGERGGSANDPELLALLRGVSAKSVGTDRFAGDGEGTGDASYPRTTSSHRRSSAEKPSVPTVSYNSMTPAPIKVSGDNQEGNAGLIATIPSPFPETGEEEDITVTMGDLPGAFSNSNWKVRKEAYRVLEESIFAAANEGSVGNLDSSTVLPGVEDMIPKLLTEKNAVALEFAMQAVSVYLENCSGGGSPDRAQAIMNSLFKGNGFTSPRPSSARVVSTLVIKLIEVGTTTETATNVMNSLVSQGLTSKKPKVVQLCASLILEATYSFGAAALPLAVIVSALPKVLTHSNKKIRDCGMEIVAEFCRALGSKAPMEEVIGKMQKSQMKDLDSLLEKQPGPTAIKVGLRNQRVGEGNGGRATSASDTLAALQCGGEALARQRYANRPPVDLIEELKQTEFESKLKLAKWSEKVGALEMALKCGGEEPYKLVQPSSSCNYVPLISQMKSLLTHTHFAVVTKAMAVLAMLAQGVGERLYPNLRPLLPKLIQLSKDKKLTKGVSSCLDAFFGNLLGFDHLLEQETSLPEATEESKEKNALVRTTALEYLDRCVVRGSSAGPRAILSSSAAKDISDFASQKLNDSDASVRKAALNVLQSLQNVEDDAVQAVVASAIECLQQSNPRAFKSLAKSASTKSSPAIPSSTSVAISRETSSPTAKVPAKKPKNPPSFAENIGAKIPEVSTTKRSHADRIDSRQTLLKGQTDFTSGATSPPHIDEALSRCTSMRIPLWDEADEEAGGVLVGIKSTKWQSRQGSIKSLAKFVNSFSPKDSCGEIQHDTESLLILVKEHTKGFKESNMNVTRSIMELFLSLCEYHKKSDCPFPSWAAKDGAYLAVEKIADRKLASLSKMLLLSICSVRPPCEILATVFCMAEQMRAPSAHEEFLLWMKSFCNEFGSHSIGPAINDSVAFLKVECSSKNVKVKRAAFDVLGVMHAHLGPKFKAIAISAFKDSLREEAEKAFVDYPHDVSFGQADWPRVCIQALAPTISDAGTSSNLQLPKTDLVSELPDDCISRMGSKDGKTAWKARKAALEDVEKVLQSSSGVIDASRMRPLVDLLRAMKERLSDSQSNLKPLAARLIGQILGSVEGDAQGKLGKVVYAPLINAAMNDNRKIMNDAAMEALQIGTSVPSVEGEGLNVSSLEPFVVALTSELEESEYKASGISGVLELAQSFTKSLHDLDNVSSQRGETLGGRFASVLVDALSSSKADIRASSESLLSDCLMDGVLSRQTVRRCIARLVPAKQRTVGTVLAKITSSFGEDGHADNLSRDEVTKNAPAKPSLAPNRKERKIPESSKQRSGIQKPSSASTTITSQKSNDSQQLDNMNSSTNPLHYEAGPFGSQKSRAAMRSLTWPEYPEEPSGSALYSGLRKAWAPLIPPDSIKKLFPDGGIRKQDDALPGFDLLRKAVAMEQAGIGKAIAEQIGFILRWSVFVMSCKESTVGLAGLLDMLSDMLSFLSTLKYEFSDGETMLFVPFLYEKASISKGRFKDSYDDLVLKLRAAQIIPSKKLGPLVCVSVMENSSHAKARLMACQVCYECVDSAGLSGIGKKGVLVVAKSLSDEKLPENKAAFLDLMVLLVSRMNNDVQRLSKICGSSLSSKARSLVEEKMKKVEKEGGLPSPTKMSGIPSRTDDARISKLPRSNQSTPASKTTQLRDFSSNAVQSHIDSMTFHDELPALDLRLGPRASLGISPSIPQQLSPPSSLPRLRLSEKSTHLQSDQNSPLLGSTVTVLRPQSEEVTTSLFASSSGSQSESSSNLAGEGPSHKDGKIVNETIGAAASLRARLLKIREKNNGSGSANGIEVSLAKSGSSDGSSVGDGIYTMQTPSLQAPTPLKPVLAESLLAIKKLFEKTPPLEENDEDVVYCTDILKNIHAAVSKQANLAVDVDAANVHKLREDIQARISEVVSTLTRVIDIGFNCHDPSFNAGMSVPLLSVNLASLMAIFRSSDLATLINVDDLTILIKEAGKALLDHRLSTTSKETSVSHLDEATSTQMVRAINKLAVQAATGATRANSLIALIRLQEQLSLNADAGETQLFNSRLSRIVTKLTSRVIKAEEGMATPYDPSTVDMETVICCLDDTLVASGKSEKEGNLEGSAATKNLAKLVIMSVLKVRGEVKTFLQAMEDLEIDPSSSSLGALVTACATELGMTSVVNMGKSLDRPDVATLVSSVGSATEEFDREQAVLALKQYIEKYGDSDLKDHLENVSAAFRDFILEQLSERLKPELPKVSNNSMSERIKSLRSKLNATEAVIQSTVSSSSIRPQTDNVSSTDGGTVSSQTNKPETKEENGVFSPNTQPQASLQAFRDRLAAAQEKRSTAGGSLGEVASSVPETSAGSRAAALRARLQAVKLQTNLMDGDK